jgi:Na+-driven multidrug efflux pump
MSTSDTVALVVAGSVVRTLGGAIGHAAEATTYILATPTLAVINTATDLSAAAATFLLFTATKATFDAAWWVSATAINAAKDAGVAGYSALFSSEATYADVTSTEKTENLRKPG